MTKPKSLDNLIALERASLERDEHAEAATWQRLSVSLGLSASLPPLAGALGSSTTASTTAANSGAAAAGTGSAAAGAATGGAGVAGGGAAGGVVATGSGALGAAAATGGTLAKLIAGVALVASGSVGGVYLWSASDTPTTSSAQRVVDTRPSDQLPAVPSRVTEAPVVPVLDTEEQPSARVPGPREDSVNDAPRRVDVQPSRNVDNFDGELKRIQKAQGALSSGDNRRALKILDDRKDSAKGQFGEDRAAVRALALCRASDPEAMSVAKRFLARYPNSVYVDGIRAACFARSGQAPPKPR